MMFSYRVLAWLIVALEPLGLARMVRLLVSPQEQMINHETQFPRPVLIRALSSLVSHHEETYVFAFSHFSVRVRYEIFLHLQHPHSLFHSNILRAVRHC